MFEERRTKGIDKSYPLQPIQNTDRTRKPLPNGFAKVSSNKVTENIKNTSTRIVENGHKISNRVAEKISSRVVENGTKVSTRVSENGMASTRTVQNGSHVSSTLEKRSIKTGHSISSHSVKKQQLVSIHSLTTKSTLTFHIYYVLLLAILQCNVLPKHFRSERRPVPSSKAHIDRDDDMMINDPQ